MKRALLDATAEELTAWMTGRGHPSYRARQVVRWVFDHRAESFDRMSDLPRGLRSELDTEWTVFETEIAHHHVSPDGTDKLLLRCRDGKTIECVLMAEADRRTVCISTQVGCGMGCVFCASGLKGVERNLSTGEILEQVLRLRNLLPPDDRLTNLVVMGMGESLANLDRLIPALDRLCSPEGLNFGQRRVTISTVGLPEKMRKLAELDRQYHLAVSLHAPTPRLRDELVPINAKVGLDAVMQAADAYFHRTGRQVTFEYVLLADLNDRPEDAEALGALLSGRKAHVNLIPYNPVAGLPYRRPSAEAVRRFERIVSGRGVSVSVRKTKGREIDAACGQLRRRLQADAGPEPGAVALIGQP
ncbi:23S rRNA (adenine(2503)-C(2))-methyltransferase RlmN [Tautonia sociabilis]|uniref:Probable dual-specificity RNA methyltransferase RlmN n=1 Tax=Tautonia sociabilis TaxID=2080755 RepID=A0A432MI39_9BACT|nr:23S rRNA (adenine(2503)-C(2))-methyltransferase RlmN [Tautonia sociabilis]RUL86863.1 23S rRNA (adenine(2503)-C(2))-methyltransferase RlmN [Tautonia sociabilis]